MSDGLRPAREQLLALASRGVTWPGWPPAPASARPSAVLVLFGALDGHLAERSSEQPSELPSEQPSEHGPGAAPADLDVLLVGRSRDLAHHPGQVSFPGGRLDPADDGPVAAALREATEETGLDAAGVEVLGELGRLWVAASDHVVTPVLGWWARPSPVRVVDPGESAHVFRAPVADLLDARNRRTVVGTHGRHRYRTPAFLVGDHVVWGFTAAVLDRVLDGLGWTEPWDTSRTIPRPP